MLDIRVGGRLYRSPMAQVEEEQDNDLGILQVREANDPAIVELQGISNTSNFAPIKLAGFSVTQAVDFNGTSKFQKVDYNYLKSLQFDEPGQYGSIEKKMNWLVNHEGEYKRPYWMEGAQCRFGSILFAKTLVKVEVSGLTPKEYIRRGQFPNGMMEDIVFYHVIGMPKSLMGIATHETHPYWITKGTAFNNDHVMTETPRGATHFHCVWNDIDYPSNYADGKLYIAKRFVI